MMSSRIISIFIVITMLSAFTATAVLASASCSHIPPMPPGWDGARIVVPTCKPTCTPVPTCTPNEPTVTPEVPQVAEQTHKCTTVVNIVDPVCETPQAPAITVAEIATPTPEPTEVPAPVVEAPAPEQPAAPASNSLVPWLALVFGAIVLVAGTYVYFVRK